MGHFSLIIFLPKKLFGSPICFDPENSFILKNLFGQKIFGEKKNLTQNFFHLNSVWAKHFLGPYYASATKHLVIGMSVGRLVLTQL